MSIATTALWVVGYLGNQSFPLMQKHLGSDGTFWCFSVAAFLNLACVFWLVPETKGRSLEDITRFWTGPAVRT
jgi:SP family arabinose:H+ symporter-like MFS transporter